MSLSSEKRAEFLALLPALGAGQDGRAAVAWARAHQDELLDEIGELPGMDQVRAGALRLVPVLLPDAADRSAVLDAADAAVSAFMADAIDGADLLRRHPAWVGLCVIELAGLRTGVAANGLARAAEVAAAGFARTATGAQIAPGEVLWALAEVAGDVGWDDHVDMLLGSAAQARFDDEENLGKVRLLQLFRLLGADEAAAAPAVEALIASDPLDARTRVQALWIGAQIDRESGRLVRALARLEEAAELVDPEDDDDALHRIRSLIRAIRGDAAAPAEA